PKNHQIGQDVGWEMRGKFLDNGYAGKILEPRSTRRYKQGPFRGVIGCEEHYLQGYDDIFACHFGRGSSSGATKYREWSKFLSLPLVNHIARSIIGHKEKRQWLAICKEIIEKQ
ncbi:unnamed protein product, partial [marine sediment metagenome]